MEQPGVPIDIVETLPPLERLAASYAPAALRGCWLGLFAFEQRLAEAARPGRDPLMVQLRLAWWRDRMAEPVAAWPAGEPLLASLAAWEAERAALRGLVDGWEARHVGEDGGADLARARIEAMVALGRLSGLGAEDPIRQAAAQWLGEAASADTPSLPRAMRPLAILRGMAVRAREAQATSPARDFVAVLRLGLIGR